MSTVLVLFILCVVLCFPVLLWFNEPLARCGAFPSRALAPILAYVTTAQKYAYSTLFMLVLSGALAGRLLQLWLQNRRLFVAAPTEHETPGRGIRVLYSKTQYLEWIRRNTGICNFLNRKRFFSQYSASVNQEGSFWCEGSEYNAPSRCTTWVALFGMRHYLGTKNYNSRGLHNTVDE